ncbi:Fe-S protein assembly co-chaperone HscB [Marinobacterium sp. CAU 1594]|nr:Fe-S protein assembly co-chaperone HscB [Marinobacterium arenosum]
MDIKQNFFELFALPVAYQVDQQQLAGRYRELQKVLHPDRFSHLSERERRLSVQYTAYLNEAQATLKSPLKRAQYLLKLQGVDTTSETSVTMEPAFLMRQMELREELDAAARAADPEAALEALQQEVADELRQQRQQFEARYQADDFDAAAGAVRKMQFLEKLVLEIEAQEDQLLD